jgi:hypothetical protein
MPLSSPPPPRHRGSNDARETRILRDRHRALTRAIDRETRSPKPYGVARIAVAIIDGGNMPTTGNHFFLANPIQYVGTECEGCPDGGQVDATTIIPVLVLGAQSPAVGDQLTAYAVGGRWVTDQAGCCQATPPGSCFVNISATICSTGETITDLTITVAGAVPPTGFHTFPGLFQFLLPSPGTYTVTASAPGFITSTTSIPLTCNQTLTVPLFPVGSTGCALVNIIGCNAFAGGPLTGFGTLTVGDNIFTMPDDFGPMSVCLPLAGTFEWTASCPGFQDMTGTVTVSSNCGAPVGLPETIILTPASGFQCAGIPCLFGSNPGFAYPLTLSLNDSVYGGATLTYDVPSATWIGSLSASVPACVGAGCPAGTSTITYTWNGCLGITYSTTNNLCPGAGGVNRTAGNTPVLGAVPFPLMMQFSVPQTCCVFGPGCGGPLPPYSEAAMITVTT